jgi:hypothetical protein
LNQNERPTLPLCVYYEGTLLDLKACETIFREIAKGFWLQKTKHYEFLFNGLVRLAL